MEILIFVALLLSACDSVTEGVSVPDASTMEDAGQSDGGLDASVPDSGAFDASFLRPIVLGYSENPNYRNITTHDGTMIDATSSHGRWTAHALTVTITTHPDFKNSSRHTGSMGAYAKGGLTKTYDDTSSVYTLNWHLQVANARLSTEQIREALAISQKEPLDIVLVDVTANRPESVAVGFASPLWALAGQGIYSTYKTEGQVGLVTFGDSAPEESSVMAYAARFTSIDMGAARAWDSETRDFSIDPVVPTISECPVVVWTSPELVSPVMTRGCITKDGDITETFSIFVSLDKLGLPSKLEIDALTPVM